MRILITNSPLHYTHGHTFTQADWQTLVLPSLAGIVGDQHEVRLLDNMTGVFRSNRILKTVSEFDPDVVAFSIIAGRDIQNTASVIRKVREAHPWKIILAGGQGASFYDRFLIDSGVDIVVRGEGEQTIPEIVQMLHASSEKRYLWDIQGIAYGLTEHGFYRTKDRPKMKDLDSCPLPRWDLMPVRKSLWFPGRFSGSVETSRGCPFSCNFCAITSFWEGSFRRKSPERIVEEMTLLVQSGRSHIYLADDNFGMGEKHHAELFELILKRGLDVRFFAQMRTDTIAKHPEMMALAARAGLYGALIGFDTYDTETFHHIAKEGSIDLNQQCAEVLRKNRIMIFGSHIYGLPTQRQPRDFAKTFWMGRKNSDLFRMPHFSLLPGTKLYDETITEDIIANASKDGDYRMMIRPAREMRRFKRWYTLFTLLHILLPDEWIKMLCHPNRNVRILKWRGYVGIFRHWFYKLVRKTGVATI